MKSIQDSAIRVGMADSVITNFNPFSLELEESIFLPSTAKTINAGRDVASSYIYARLRDYSIRRSGLPVHPGCTNSAVKKAIQELADGTEFVVYSSSQDRIMGKGPGSLYFGMRHVPTYHLQASGSLSKKDWLAVTAIMAFWEKTPTLTQVVQTAKVGDWAPFCFNHSDSWVKLVNKYDSADKAHTAYSFVQYSPIMETSFLTSRSSAEFFPVLVHVWIDNTSTLGKDAPFLRTLHLEESHPGPAAAIPIGLFDGWGAEIYNLVYNPAGAGSS